jgi:hypothetical protein
MFTQTERSAAVQTGIRAEGRLGAAGAAEADETAQTADPVPRASAAAVAAAARRIVVLIFLLPIWLRGIAGWHSPVDVPLGIKTQR